MGTPRIYVCFLWHMHQPYYKDLVSGEYRLPWTRLHALKDYWGMVKILGEFPGLRQTFNLVPSMVAQIEEYASGQASDPFLRLALKPAEDLSPGERAFILKYLFQANVERMIHRYPRYGELYERQRAGVKEWTAAELRDLQVLSQLAWFDEEDHAHDPLVRALGKKGRGFHREDQRLLGDKQIEALGRVVPVYREFALAGQIEVSTTPFYHPILPLLCDTQIAAVAHPGVALPPRFSYPEDAREQLRTARAYMADRLDGMAPVGLWPSEGSVSDAALTLAAEEGFQWAATDNGVLSRTLQRTPGPETGYRPYVWRQGGHELKMLFRDHELSDLIGFTYQRTGAREGAQHFLRRIRENAGSLVSHGRDALVPVILDGENCWEYYHESGRDFLRFLYQGILDDPQMEAVTVSEGLACVEPVVLEKIFPGSWINANFDVWIGAEEDNTAWEYLLAARQAYENSPNQNQLAYEELLIAEGSDWCWWYGPEHHSDNREEFDQLFRDHLKNVYVALGLPIPEALFRPILKNVAPALASLPPCGPVKAVLDGDVTSYFEWLHAGVHEVDGRQGAMHGGKTQVGRMWWGRSGGRLYLRLDPLPGAEGFDVRIENDPARAVETVRGRVVECAVEWGEEAFAVLLERDGVPLQRLPAAGRLPV